MSTVEVNFGIDGPGVGRSSWGTRAAMSGPRSSRKF